MITVIFFAFLALSMTVALVDWRRGWLLAILCGVLQDPARKLTAGHPVAMSLSIVLVYAVVLFAAQSELQVNAKDFTRRFGSLYAALILVFVFLALAAVNGIATFGLANWKIPALSFFIYCLPVPAVIVGYAWPRREEQVLSLFRFYAILTSIALIGTPLEYFNVHSPILGTVGIESNLRFITGIEIRLLSGIYRAPDIMGWHAATLACIGVIMALKRRAISQSWPWLLATGWGFLNCVISGRRKAVYMFFAFVAVLLWRYFRRLKISEIATIILLVAVLALVARQLGKSEESSIYTRGTATTQEELFGRLEGGVRATVDQYGFMGAGLGTATQGTRHLSGGTSFSWQEGGLGKLAIELGVPGLLSLSILIAVMLQVLLKISRHPDIPESSQLIRAGLFAMFVGDAVTFLASAQAYSDPLLALLSAFTLGCVFAASQFDERVVPTLERDAVRMAGARVTAPA
ncbi:MAG: hypothetical protein QOK37_2051 [Thermoanaerobaculia bacterium]|jgi:hypothetical protein|nr:hypothetical protein [Thermoanaerobaculia bacterium]